MAPFAKGFLIQLIICTTLGAFAISTNNCPMTCFCDQKPVGEEAAIPGGYGLKVHCLPSVDSGKSDSFNIRLPSNTIHLDLANYGIREIEAETFLGLLHLQKLDLQGNEINTIGAGAFASLPKLQNLDLSRNQLEKIEKGTFSGLVSLRRLKLNGNNLTSLEQDSFLPLKAIEKVDLSDNPLVCDCKMGWLVEWIGQAHSSSKIQNVAKTKCAMPIEKANVPILKLVQAELQCNSGGGIISSFHSSEVFLSPSNNQVVFQGDELSFHCRTNSLGQQWVLNGSPLEHNGNDLIITHVGRSSVLRISSLETTFQGKLDCIAAGGGDERSKASIHILVLPRKTPVCNPITLSTSRGTYYFQASVAGLSVTQPCKQKRTSYEGDDSTAIASLQCRQTGEWAASVNVSKCAYTSDFTDTLQKFASSMNVTSFTPNTLVESASHFLNYTANAESFANPMDVVFFSQAVENYLPYLKEYNDVGHFMMDMVGNVLQVNSALLYAAQKDGLACSRLLNVMENITKIAVPASFRHHAANIAMESFTIKPSQRFDGISCSWYESSFTMYRYSTRRDFHCAQSNKTIENPDKKLIISMVVPPSLYNHIDYQLVSSYGSSIPLVQLMFAVFANSSLFPGDSSHQTPKEVPVIGAKLLGGSSHRKLNLTEPVVISVRTFSPPHQLIPVVWDHWKAEWTSRPCYIIGHTDGVLRFACIKLGYYSLLHDTTTTTPPGGNDKMTESKWHHHVLYFGTGIAWVLITVTWIVFIWRWPVIEITPELKHSLLNVWFCLLVSLHLFAMGIYQSNLYCQLVAITLHYSTITCFNWLFVGVYIIYTKVSKTNSEQQKQIQLLSDHVDVLLVKDQQAHPTNLADSTKSYNNPNDNGIIRLYIFAYGISTFIVAITASSSATNYSMPTGFCFLTTTTLAPLVGGFFVPLAFISTVMIGFGLSIVCVLATSPYKVKERSLKQQRCENHTLAALDNLQSPKQALLWHAITFFCLCLALTSAGFLCYERTTSRSALDEDNDSRSIIVLALFSTLFSLAIVSFAIFNFVHFCLCRRDIYILSCLKHFTCSEQSDENQVESPENEELVTENFVELCARPLPAPAQVHTDYAQDQPKTSSPVHSHIPLVQDITVSPLTMVNVLTADGEPASTQPVKAYSVVPLQAYKQAEISLASVNTGISYTDSSTIRMGAPCDMATFDTHAPPSGSASLIGTGTPRRLFGLAPHVLNQSSSTSLPRSLRHSGKPLRKPALMQVMLPADEDLQVETQSKFSIGGSSTRSGHSKASSRQHRRHKKPNRRRSRQQLKTSGKDKEPVYNNLKENEDIDYLGDADDQFDDMLEDRFHKKNEAGGDNEYPSVIHEAEGDEEEEMMILDEDNDSLSQGREEPASLEDLAPNLADLSKRETSV